MVHFPMNFSSGLFCTNQENVLAPSMDPLEILHRLSVFYFLQNLICY